MKFFWQRDPLDRAASNEFREAWESFIKGPDTHPLTIRRNRAGAWEWLKITCAKPECRTPPTSGFCYGGRGGEVAVPVFFCEEHATYIRDQLINK